MWEKIQKRVMPFKTHSQMHLRENYLTLSPCLHPSFPHISSQESLHRDATWEGTSAHQLKPSIAALSCKFNSLCFSCGILQVLPLQPPLWAHFMQLLPSLSHFQLCRSSHCLQILAPIIYLNCLSSSFSY